MSELTIFDGFEDPKENYSKLPHSFIEQLPRFKSASEIKVVLYILRHTWGFQDTEKRITLDEFERGRKMRDGKRMDGGVGMARGSIRLGLKQAEAHGFIRRESDGKDKARQSYYYSLIVRNEPAEGQKLTPRGAETDNRSEKETLERNKRKKKSFFSKSQSPKDEPMSELARKEMRARARFLEERSAQTDLA